MTLRCVGGCGRCPNVRGPWVGSRGSGSIAIVGEAPGRNEFHYGKPFIGPAGQLLNSSLIKAGFEDGLGSCYITNAMMCRPPETPIPKGTIEACSPRLHEELLENGPFDLVIALGNPAIRSLTGNHNLKVGSVRGTTFDLDVGLTISTYHPAAILRDHTKYGHLIKDLRTAYGLLNGERKDPGVTKYMIVTPDNIGKVVAGLLSKPILSCDIETTGFDFLSDRLLCFGVGFAKNQVAMFGNELLEEYSAVIAELFESEGPKWVWHNGKFDLKFLQALGFNARLDDDTMLMHYALDETRGTHDLGQLARLVLGAPNYKDMIKNWKGHFEYAPKKLLYDYCAKDVDNTFQLRSVLWEELNKAGNAGLPELYRETLLPASDMLLDVERVGIYVDKAALESTGEDMDRQLKEVYARCQELAAGYWDAALYSKQEGTKQPGWFNLNSWQQVSWVIYKRMGLKPKKGYPHNTAENTLRNLEVSHPFVESLLEYRKLAKSISTYIVGIGRDIASDGRVHTTFKIHGTVTGRLSSGEEDEVSQ